MQADIGSFPGELRIADMFSSAWRLSEDVPVRAESHHPTRAWLRHTTC